MATVTLTDFEDLYTAIAEELKVQLTDGTTIGRIKRDINMIYLDHVIPAKPRAWWWLETNENIQTIDKITTGTVDITDDSTTVTFSSAPSSSVAGYYLKVSGFVETIKISSHTGGNTTATLESAWRRGNVSGNSFKLWKDNTTLDSNTKEVIQVTHEHMREPMEYVTVTDFKMFRSRNPDLEGYPEIFTIGDFDSSGDRKIYWYPAIDDFRYTLHVEGRQEATALSSDTDEPLMPVEDRIVIFYGACSRAWARERNETESAKNWNLFLGKLNQMMGRSEGAPKTTQMEVSSDYLVNKRYRRMWKHRRGKYWRSD